MKRAFTLIEMMLVLAIISILIGTMKIQVQHKKLQAEVKNIVECVKIYEAALTMYYLRNGCTFPGGANEETLENVDALASYRPTGFTTLGSIHSGKCQSITIFDTNNNYGVQIVINEAEDLGNELVEQLKEFALASQITIENTTVKYYLKKGNDIYI